jgi:hypothetical protein
MAPGVAAVATGAVLSLRAAAHRPERTITLSVLIACTTLIAFADAPALAIAFALLAVGSVALSIAQIHVFTRIQQITRPPRRKPRPLRGNPDHVPQTRRAPPSSIRATFRKVN